MKRLHFIAAACVLMLAGCAGLKWVPTLEERSRPQVSVKDGRIFVSPEILFYFPDEREVLIVWQLPKDARYRFPKDGIVIEGKLSDRSVAVPGTAGPAVALERQDEIVNCMAQNEFEFTCLNRHRVPGVYKYTIRVVDVETKKTLERDPPVVNW